MANPSLQKTWQFNVNNYVPANSSLDGTNAYYNRRALLLGIKNALKGFGTLPWTVVSSSDSTATGASDLWVDEGDLVWRDDDFPANAFSWIVLRQTGISTTFELLITCEENALGNDGAEIGAWVAQAGFTGGTTTTRPTATDERLLRNSTFDGSTGGHWGSGGDGGNALDYQFHVMQSTDGQSTRVLIFVNYINTGLWLFEKPANPNSNWTDPYVATILGNNDAGTNQATYARLYDTAWLRSRFNGVDLEFFLSGEGFGSAAVGEQLDVPNQLDGKFIASGIGLSCESATFYGRMAEITDLWWGFTSQVSGRYFPSDTSAKNFVQVKDMIFPWDGSTLIAIS